MKHLALILAAVLTLLLPACAQESATATTFTDADGVTVTIPAGFTVSNRADEQLVATGLVVIAPDKSEYVWIPVPVGMLVNDPFASESFFDEESEQYQLMYDSLERFGGFYLGRYETSKGRNDVPQSVPSEPEDIWVLISPQDMTEVCAGLYADNSTVNAFLPWGINWDATLRWLVHSGDKSIEEITDDSSSWGNYANNEFAEERGYGATGQWEETRANNIYDLAGNYWEWTQERTAKEGYVLRAGGYTIMGRAADGSEYPAAYRVALPGTDHHPNVTFRIALYLTDEAA